MQPLPRINTFPLLDKSRFAQLWRSMSIDFDAARCDRVFNELLELYSGFDRHYHSASHIQHCLDMLDEAVANSDPAPHVEMAIWFHDVIYHAGDPLNERNSVEWFRKRAEGDLRPEDIDKVSSLITITEHRDSPTNENEKLMVDIDLSSFGLPEPQFIEDGRNVRIEFVDLTDEQFIEGQSAFLKGLLARPALYSTQYFFTHYEQTARTNIANLLQRYQTGGLH